MLGYRIKVEREKKGLNKSQLAEMVGVTQAAIVRFEDGTKVPSAGTVKDIAIALNVTTDYLLGMKED